MSPGAVASHVHLVFGGSNFGVEIPSSEYLRQSECTSTHIAEDKSAYWFPQLYFERADGSFDHVGGGPVIYYLYDPPDPPDPAGKPGKPGATSFPDNFRMITGSASEEPEMGSREQRAVSFLCLDFNGKTDPPYDSLPKKLCPSGIRAQIVSAVCMSLSNRLPQFFSPRTSKVAGTDGTPTLPTTNLTSIILRKDPIRVPVLLNSRSASPVSSARCTMALSISMTSATWPRTPTSPSCTL